MPTTEDTKHAININIYKVALPNEEFKRIYSVAETFHYEGRAIAAGKTAAGGVFFLPALAAKIAGACLTLMSQDPFPYYVGDKTLGHVVDLGKGITNFGFSSKITIPSKFIVGTCNEHNKLKKRNSNFICPTQLFRVIYVLDGGNPQEVWEKGISYLGLEHPTPVHPPIGNVIFFSNFVDALKCAQLRTNGKMYDKQGGWRRYHAWTEEERTNVVEGPSIKQSLEKHTKLPGNLVNITNEYLGFFKKTGKKESTSNSPSHTSSSPGI